MAQTVCPGRLTACKLPGLGSKESALQAAGVSSALELQRLSVGELQVGGARYRSATSDAARTPRL